MIPQTENPQHPTRVETTTEVRPWMGMDLFKPDATLGVNESKLLSNVELFAGEYLKTRPSFTRPLVSGGAERAVWWKGKLVRFFRWYGPINTQGIDTTVVSVQEQTDQQPAPGHWDFTYHAISGTLHDQLIQPSVSLQDLCLLPDREKLYVFGKGITPFIIEETGSTPPYRSRPLGLPAPAPVGTTAGAGGVAATGQYQLAFEAIRIENNADVLSSSPTRKYFPSASWDSGTSEWVLGNKANFAIWPNHASTTLHTVRVALPKELRDNPHWTHIRMYRSKNLLPDNDGFVEGVSEEVYPIAMWERKPIADNQVVIFDFISASVSNDWEVKSTWGSDQSLPLTAHGGVMTSYPYLDLSPLPNFSDAILAGDKIWGLTEKENVVGYSLPSGDQYSELYDPTRIVPAPRGNYGGAVKLATVGEHIVFFLNDSTFYLPRGQIDQGWVPISKSIGISDLKLCANLPGLGVLISSNEDDTLKVLTPGMQYSYAVGGQDISRKISPEWSKYARIVLQYEGVYPHAALWKGKLLISVGNGMYVLHYSEGLGFSHWETELLSRGDYIHDLAVDSITGKGVAPAGAGVREILFGGEYLAEGSDRKFSPNTEIPPKPVPEDILIPWQVSTGAVQQRRGGEQLELRGVDVQMHHWTPEDFSYVAGMRVSRSSYYNEITVPYQDFEKKNIQDDPTIPLDQMEYVTQWEWYPAREEVPHRMVGERFFFTLIGFGKMILVGMRVRHWVQNDRRPGWSSEDRDDAAFWMDYSMGLVHHLSRPAIGVDRMFRGTPESRRDRTVFIRFSPEGVANNDPLIIRGGGTVVLGERNPHRWYVPSGIFEEGLSLLLADGGLGEIDPNDFKNRWGYYPGAGTGVIT